MKISLEKKILFGFIANVLIVVATIWVFILLINSENERLESSNLKRIQLSLLSLLFVLLPVVYFIIRSQLRAKNSTQEQLLENRKLLQSIIDNTTNPVFIKKLNGEYLLVNKQYENLFNTTNEKIIGKTDYDFLPKETADIYRDSDFEVAKALKELKIEETIHQPDGAHTYIAVKFPLYDSTGRVYAIGGISTDITERKKAEESIKAGDNFFKMSIEMMVIASNDRFIKINPTIIKTLGYSEEELLTQSFFKYIHVDDIEITKKEIEKLQTRSTTIKFENRWVCKNGAIKWFSWSASLEPQTKLLYAIASDVTEWKEAQKSLIYSDTFFNLSFDVFFLAKKENIIKINPAFTRIFGFELKDIENKSFLTFIHPENLIETTNEVKKLLTGTTITNFRTRSICKDGTYKWTEWSTTADTRTGTIFAAGRDVTELIENEESLKMANSFFEMSFDSFFVSKGKQVIKINPALTKTLGYTLKDLENKSFLDLIHPDYLKTASEKFTKRFQGAELEPKVVYPVLCKDGTYKWLEIMLSINITTGTIYAILEDITQKIKNEEVLKTYNLKLKENEQQIQTIFDGAPDPVIVIDRESKIIKWNPKAEFIFGWKAIEVEGKELAEIIIPIRNRETNKKQIESILANGHGGNINKATELEGVNKTGKEFPISLNIAMAKLGDKNVFIGFVRDISLNKKIINDLHEQEEMLRLVLENIAEGVIVADADKKIVMANDIANNVFGIQEDKQTLPDLISRFEIYYPDEKTIFPSQNLPMEHVLSGETMEDVDVVLFDPIAKQKIRVLISGRPLINTDNSIAAAVVTIKDISKYKQLEAELKESEIKYRQLIGFNKREEKVV
jgi:PAS domain S-box-containing protein